MSEVCGSNTTTKVPTRMSSHHLHQKQQSKQKITLHDKCKRTDEILSSGTEGLIYQEELVIRITQGTDQPPLIGWACTSTNQQGGFWQNLPPDVTKSSH